MDITTGHWIFAGIFVVTFLVVLYFAYASDRSVSPEYFSGTAKFLFIIILTLMTLVIVKVLFRANKRGLGMTGSKTENMTIVIPKTGVDQVNRILVV